MIIVVEGFDGCGKDSVADALALSLGAARLNFPDDASPHTGEIIRSYLRREWSVQARPALPDPAYGFAPQTDLKFGALALQALCLANRLEHQGRLVAAAGDFRDHLVLARYWPSGWVYGQLDGLDRGWIEKTNEAFPDADLYLLLDVPAEVCLERRAARDGKVIAPERYEGKLDLARRAVDLYRELWDVNKGWDPSWVKLDATRPLEQVIGDAIRNIP